MEACSYASSFCFLLLFLVIYFFRELIFTITLIIIIVWLDNWQFFTVFISVCWEVLRQCSSTLNPLSSKTLKGGKVWRGRSSPQVRSPRHSSIVVADKHRACQIGRGSFGLLWIEEQPNGRGLVQIFFQN